MQRLELINRRKKQFYKIVASPEKQCISDRFPFFWKWIGANTCQVQLVGSELWIFNEQIRNGCSALFAITTLRIVISGSVEWTSIHNVKPAIYLCLSNRSNIGVATIAFTFPSIGSSGFDPTQQQISIGMFKPLKKVGVKNGVDDTRYVRFVVHAHNRNGNITFYI